jgi:hypothetical protein
MVDSLDKLYTQFDANAFAERHGGHKESPSARSREWLLPCPAPSCASDRLRWRHEPGVKMAWICWGCGRSGDTLDLICQLEQVDREGAIAFLDGEYVGGDAPSELRTKLVVPKPSAVTLDRLPQIRYPNGYETIDPNLPMHARARAYLASRGIFRDAISEYGIGFARTGRLANYVIFPVFMDGGLVYWQARATWDPPHGATRDYRKAWERATKYRKTLNPVSYGGATTADQVIFNYDRARAEPHVVVCEGPVDAIKVGAHAVALLGKASSPTKIERLLRLPAQRYTVYLDPGEAEREKAEELATQLSEFAPTFIATPPPGYDPGALTQEQNTYVIANAPPFKPTGLVSNLRF